MSPRNLTSEQMGPDMARFFSPQNLDRYRKLASAPISSDEREQIIRTLADEMRVLKTETKNEGMGRSL